MQIINATGQIINDPRTGKAQKGYRYANFEIACYGSNDKDEPIIIDVSCFGQPADTVCEYCTKGTEVLVCGEGGMETKVIDGTTTKRLKITAKIVNPEETHPDYEAERSTVSKPKQQSTALEDDDPWA